MQLDSNFIILSLVSNGSNWLLNRSARNLLKENHCLNALLGLHDFALSFEDWHLHCSRQAESSLVAYTWLQEASRMRALVSLSVVFCIFCPSSEVH